MGFFDKVKDLFTDEEEIIETEEIEVEENEEHKLPTFMRNKIEEEQKREERKKQLEQPKTNVINEREMVKTRSNNNFSFPMDLDESDMIPDIGYSKQNIIQHEREKEKEKEKKLADLYAKKEEPKPKKFRPTPVISPVYGVLDKNYTKDEVKVQDESSYEIQRTPRKVDFESVRNKAFGSLTDDIKNAMCENCELYQEVKIIKNANKKVDKKDMLLSDMIDEPTKEDITIEDATDNYYDFGVAYETPKREEKTVINVEEAIVNNEIKIVNHNAEESTAEKIEVKEEPEKKKTKKAAAKTELTVEDLLEDTKEFDKISTDEEDISSILGSEDDIPLSAETSDIFDLMDSIYDEEDR